MHHQIESIGVIHSPFKQKFAVPRQPGLVTAARACIELQGEYAQADCVRGLDAFSHLWVLFLFHQTMTKGWSPLVRPPRLGGNTRKGVFATRATYRPNGIGMSVVKIEQLEVQPQHVRIWVQGADWVDGTPVIDLKPYLPYADSIADASGGFADQRPETHLRTRFSNTALTQIAALAPAYPNLQLLITQVLQQDPRPAYQQTTRHSKIYGMSLWDLNIKWQVVDDENQVLQVTKDF